MVVPSKPRRLSEGSTTGFLRTFVNPPARIVTGDRQTRLSEEFALVYLRVLKVEIGLRVVLPAESLLRTR